METRRDPDKHYVQLTKMLCTEVRVQWHLLRCDEPRLCRGPGLAGMAWWEYVDSDTVLIGHSLQNDLKVVKPVTSLSWLFEKKLRQKD